MFHNWTFTYFQESASAALKPQKMRFVAAQLKLCPSKRVYETCSSFYLPVPSANLEGSAAAPRAGRPSGPLAGRRRYNSSAAISGGFPEPDSNYNLLWRVHSLVEQVFRHARIVK